MTRARGAVLLLAACGGGAAGAGAAPDPGGHGLFHDAVAQVPAGGVVPFEVNSILYADETIKLRFLRLPEGGRIGYDNEGRWEFPDGTFLVKTFFYPRDARDPASGRRLVETRLLIEQDGVWRPEIHAWNEEQTATERVRAGRRVPATWIDASGAERSIVYRVPDENQCAGCHARDRVLLPLGPRTRQLSRDRDYGDGQEDQLDHLAALGAFGGPIPPAAARPRMPEPYGDAPLAARARSYLDANCAHCHQPGGAAASTGLDLRWEAPEGISLGICRRPVAAGRGSGGLEFDIVPGDPDASIMVFRMASTDPGIKMPELPTVTRDQAGLGLIGEWVASLPPGDCE